MKFELFRRIPLMREIDENGVTVDTLGLALDRAHDRYMDHHLRTKGSDNLGVKKLRKRQVGDDCKATTTTPAPPRFISSLTNLGNVKNILMLCLNSILIMIITIIRCITTVSSR